MKNTICFVATLLVSLTAIAQSSSPAFEFSPSFYAVVVKNVDASGEWYKKVFGLTTGKQLSDDNLGVRIMVLESASFKIELLELRGSLVRQDLLQGKGQGTQIQGHFKMGFNVKDIETCLKHLADIKIDVPQVWEDSGTKKKNFLISDPDGNLIQFFQSAP